MLAHDPALQPPPVEPAPGDLPSGVVTFLLTDVEGSTRLWEAEPAAMALAMQRHDELIAGTIQARGGRLLKAKGEGDATLSVFKRASDAVAAAAALQDALEAASWPGGLELRVRIAVHTGEAFERDDDYFGPALNRAARLRALAPGGATVVSQTTAEIVRDRLAPGCSSSTSASTSCAACLDPSVCSSSVPGPTSRHPSRVRCSSHSPSRCARGPAPRS